MGIWAKLMGRDVPGEDMSDEDMHAQLDAEREASVAEFVAQSRVIEAARPFPNRPDLLAAGLRPGMWVMTTEGIGIITGCLPGGVAQVTLTKEDGTTKMMLDADDKAVPHVVLGDVSTLKQADIEDIVALHSDSRPAPDAEQLLKFGYQHRSAA